MTDAIHVLGFSGSLRKTSFNTSLLRAAEQMLPEGMTLELFDLSPIPLFNQDLELHAPQPVHHFKERIRAADALLIATPEYNYSIPGVLKNAIDWASRPPKENPFDGKPLAMMGAGGVVGTARAQIVLRQVAVFLNMHPLNKPEVRVARAWEKFDQQGNLTDEAVRHEVHGLLVALLKWAQQLKK